MHETTVRGMMVYSAEEMGSAIRARRKKLGYTQEEIAEFQGCSPRFIGELERGMAASTISRAIEIMNNLGLDVVIVERGGDR